MNCPNCNASVNDGAERCPNCGFLIGGITPEPLPNPANEEVAAPSVVPNVEGQTPEVAPSPVDMPDLSLPSVDNTETTATPEVAPTPVANLEPTVPTTESAPVPESAPTVDSEAYKVNTEPVAAPEAPVAASLQIEQAPVIEAAPAAQPVNPTGPVIEPVVAAIEPATSAPAPEQKPAKEKKKISPLTILIFALLILVIAAAVILYTRGFFDNLLGKNKASASNPSQVVDNNDNNKENENKDDSETEEQPQTQEVTSISLGGYEFAVPEGYTYSVEADKGHLKNADDTIDVIAVDVYSGKKEDIQSIISNIRSTIESAGYTFDTSRSGTRNGKYYSVISYLNSGTKYETLLIVIDDNNTLALSNLKTSGLTTDDFIQLGSNIIDGKAATSSPASDLKPVSEAMNLSSQSNN